MTRGETPRFPSIWPICLVALISLPAFSVGAESDLCPGYPAAVLSNCDCDPITLELARRYKFVEKTQLEAVTRCVSNDLIANRRMKMTTDCVMTTVKAEPRTLETLLALLQSAAKDVPQQWVDSWGECYDRYINQGELNVLERKAVVGVRMGILLHRPDYINQQIPTLNVDLRFVVTRSPWFFDSIWPIAGFRVSYSQRQRHRVVADYPGTQPDTVPVEQAVFNSVGTFGVRGQWSRLAIALDLGLGVRWLAGPDHQLFFVTDGSVEVAYRCYDARKTSIWITGALITGLVGKGHVNDYVFDLAGAPGQRSVDLPNVDLSMTVGIAVTL